MPVGAAEKRQLSLDSNVLIDLANEEPFAIQFRLNFQRNGYSLRVAPRVLAELHYGYKTGGDDLRRSCEIALRSLLNWNIVPFTLDDLKKAWTKNFLNIAEERRLFPPLEKSDAIIVAETAVEGIPILVTSDRFLLRVHADDLSVALADAGLHGVQIMSARKLGASRQSRR